MDGIPLCSPAVTLPDKCVVYDWNVAQPHAFWGGPTRRPCAHRPYPPLEGEDTHVVHVHGAPWASLANVSRRCKEQTWRVSVLVMSLDSANLPPADDLLLWAAECDLLLYSVSPQKSTTVSSTSSSSYVDLTFLSWPAAMTDLAASLGCPVPQNRAMALSPILRFVRDIAAPMCPPMAPRICPLNHSFLPSRAERVRRGIPLGCPLVPDHLSDTGLGNRLGLLLTYATLGRVLQRPIIVYWPTTSLRVYGSSSFEDFQRLSTIGDGWGGVHFVGRASYKRALRTAEVLRFPSPRERPPPVHSTDLIPEAAYHLLHSTGHLEGHPTSAGAWRCVSPLRWMWHAERAAKCFRPRVYLGLPAPRTYLALYIRRGDKGSIDGTRLAALNATIRKAVRLAAAKLPTLSWLVVTANPEQRQWALDLFGDSAARIHPLSVGALETHARRLSAWRPFDWGGGFARVRLLQDYFLMSRAAGLLVSDPWGNPTLAISAKWTTGGWLPMLVVDPQPPEGHLWAHQETIQDTGFFRGLRECYFHPNISSFLQSVGTYTRERPKDGGAPKPQTH